MASCCVCGNFDDDSGAIGDPNYQPDLYYYWHGDIQEDYQMPAGYDCLCEKCFGDLLNAGKIIEADDPSWDPETMGWFKPLSQSFQPGLNYNSL